MQAIAADEVLGEVRSSVGWAGDAGAGPDPAALQSERFADLLRGVLAEVEGGCAGADRIESFWLKKWHPAYPVWWDFAFLFRCADKGVVLIGSSSD